MKKLIVTACAAIASAVALASTVESSNVFGVLKVAGSDGTNIKDFIIPVPWEAVGTAGTAISPTALVLASALNDPDALLFEYGHGTSSKFGAWYNDNGTWATANISAKNLGDYVEASTRTTIGRGYALVLRTKSQNIYLSGQYSGAQAEVTIAQASLSGETLTPAMTLLGGSRVADIDLNYCTFAPDPSGDDKIMFADGTVYTYNTTSKKWQKKTGNTVEFTLPDGKTKGQMPEYTIEGVTIPSGTGAWYVRYGTDAMTITIPQVSAN